MHLRLGRLDADGPGIAGPICLILLTAMVVVMAQLQLSAHL